MKRTINFLPLLFLLTACAVKNPDALVRKNDVERIIKTLAADDMQGRAPFTPGIEKAADFIANEFKNAGLAPMKGEKNFRQSFTMSRITQVTSQVTIDGNVIDDDQVMIISDSTGLKWNDHSNVEIVKVERGQQFFTKYRQYLSSKKPLLVLVSDEYADAFKRLRDRLLEGRIVQSLNLNTNVVFVLGVDDATSFRVNFSNKIEELSLFNVAGVIPGKSRPNEIVVFSGHYDHLGIIDEVKGDSIANGADDDASGVTAVIALANYYKKLNNNERTLIFVAFTAEESGGFGSKYFSSQVNPDEVVAMFNIEMIGKDSKFGKNSAFITGYERSDFGTILQKNLEGTGFTFHPDPYPDQQLFYRSDNATLAALGVPAHTISTDKIDVDKFYHTVDDEFETLDVNNIIATIKAIALSSRSIVAGTDTPKRIPKLEPRR